MSLNAAESEIHVFNVADRYFLFDVEAGDLYALSQVAFELLSDNIHDVSQINHLTFDKWKALKQTREVLGNIRPLTEAESSEIVRSMEAEEFEMFGLWLGLSHSCNLACQYCFANEPTYLGSPKLMSWEVAKRAVDFLISKSSEKSHFELIFFGGEPLLNFGVMDRIIDYCTSLEKSGTSFSFSLTTNGTLLSPEVYHRLISSGVSIMLSIDGPAELHDSRRRFRNGAPSWQIIFDNLNRLPDFGHHIIARSTVIDTKVDLVTIFKKVMGLGFKDIALTEVCPNSGAPPVFPAEEIAKWKLDYLELATYAGSLADSIEEIPLAGLREFMHRLLGKGRSYYCCSTGLSFFYVTPEGEIYPCSRLLTKERHFRLGNVFNDLDIKIIREFKKNHVFNKVCRTCWARYLCGGQCYGDALFITRELGRPVPGFCAMTKHKIEVAAYVLDDFRQQSKLPENYLDGKDNSGSRLTRLISRLRFFNRRGNES